jgi:hypothetical protein
MALTFNGSTQYGRIANNTLFNVTPNLTIMGWAYTTSTSGMQRIASRYLNGATANEQYGIDIFNMAPRFLVGTTSAMTTATGGTITTNQWYHVCGVYNGSTMLVYLNGVQVASTTRSGTITSSTGVFSFGADYNGSAASEFLTGALEDIRVYGRALSAQELQTIWTLKGADGIVNGLVVRLPLNTGAAGTTLAASATIYDISNNKLNATNIVAGSTFSAGAMRSRKYL